MRTTGIATAIISLTLTACGGGGSKTNAASDNFGSDNAGPSRALVASWPEKWCRAKPGISRAELWRIMGKPTTEDSGKLALIPHVGTKSPPEPQGSDTWEAPGSYQFNSFYNPDLDVQQLDFNGPKDEIGCPVIRVRR
jgi:hypothetical protein